MSFLTIDMLRKLKSVGFCFPQYEHECNIGMTYYFDGNEYTIGGNWNEDVADDMACISKHGQWLPDEQQLMEWLQKNKFDMTIKWCDENQYFYCNAVDTLTKQEYSAGGIDILNCLAKLIYKICKAMQRELIPSDNLVLEIIRE